MRPRSDRATSLLEVLIAIMVLIMVMFGIYNIQQFGDYHLVTSSRRARVQKDAVYLLTHMGKQLMKSVSNGKTYPVDLDPGGTMIRFWVDKNADGILQDHLESTPDTLVYYNHSSSGVVTYCSDANITGYPAGSVSCSAATEIIANHITSNFNSSYIVTNNTTDYVLVNVTSCWDPANPSTCGSVKNPSISFKSRLEMPSVSTF